MSWVRILLGAPFTKKIMTVREKITTRMNELQRLMEANIHLEDPDQVEDVISSVSKFWPFVSEEDRDYLQAAAHIVEDQTRWDV
jgi:hypothetical protein